MVCVGVCFLLSRESTKNKEASKIVNRPYGYGRVALVKKPSILTQITINSKRNLNLLRSQDYSV